MSEDSDLSSLEGSSSPAPVQPASPEKPTANRYDTMFGSDHESEAVPAGSTHGGSSDDEDAGPRKRKRRAGDGDDDDENANTAAMVADGDEDEQLDDLFGDESDKNELSDRELGSDRNSLTPGPPAAPERFVEIALPRHPGPAPGIDSNLYIMKIPTFLTMEPSLFDPEKFVLPTVDRADSTSAYTKATTSIRVRRDPRNSSLLQSNARVIRWSDGTMSLQIASSPHLYDLPQKGLTTDPTRPDKYVANQDSHMYLLDPHESAGTLRVIGHATQSLNVVSASVNLANDQAIQRLHSEFASAIPNAARKTPLEMSELRDPEAERKEAERIAKEKERANKKLEAQRRRARERDPLDSAARRPYARAAVGTRSKRDSPPITTGRGRGKEDEYDLEDEFIEGSDEDAEDADSDDDDEEEERRPRRKGESERERKRRRVVDESDEE